ncbi:thiol-disulfide oxidoreductase DCC family protein [Shewanella pneumatophori]|uniref:DCC1-like thiol-disulfide oxidoreductase family protein n=1 Tax=Shewanella pneumatophori TaxID=314092 RepID=A0A9X1ZES3_9GAMM|nr:DCC1-like thiol-disulfide oxidoreductase family protein [Shewanella pneumatophori]MCL1140231.1 DCC1-like thiol-disulfide oxidoreductase family protein [Shewanella pneumatophori]
MQKITEQTAVVIFDGACNLCDGAVSVITRHDPHKEFELVALQSIQGQALLSQYQLTDVAMDSVVLIKQQHSYLRSDAVIEIAKRLHGWPRLLRHAALLPKGLRNAIYNLIAKHRYRLFGQKAICQLPKK